MRSGFKPPHGLCEPHRSPFAPAVMPRNSPTCTLSPPIRTLPRPCRRSPAVTAFAPPPGRSAPSLPPPRLFGAWRCAAAQPGQSCRGRLPLPAIRSPSASAVAVAWTAARRGSVSWSLVFIFPRQAALHGPFVVAVAVRKLGRVSRIPVSRPLKAVRPYGCSLKGCSLIRMHRQQLPVIHDVNCRSLP